MLTAREIMNRSLIHVERGTTVAAAAKQMIEHHVGSIIVTAGGYPVGIVTETDITRLVSGGTDAANTLLEDIMSSPLFSTNPDTDITEIVDSMTINHIKKMPVIEHQRVIGIITQTDIVRNVLYLIHKAKAAHPVQNVLEMGEFPKLLRSEEAHTRYWYMRCLSCGNTFLNAEHDGKLRIHTCPRCSGSIDYDPNPPI